MTVAVLGWYTHTMCYLAPAMYICVEGEGGGNMVLYKSVKFTKGLFSRLATVIFKYTVCIPSNAGTNWGSIVEAMV